MLSIETLHRKKRFIKKTGEVIVDLTKSTIYYLFNPRYKTVVEVSDEYAMRPDLIAKAEYGDDNKLDYICKYNGISNPFSVYPGQALFIPDDSDMEKQFRDPNVDDNDNTTKRASDFAIEPTTKKDAKRLDTMKQKANKNKLFPPNINKPEDKNIKFRDGKIIFGEDVTTVNKENCPTTISRARLKEKLISKNIFK